MFVDQLVNDRAISGKGGEGCFLIFTHKARLAYDIGSEDCRESTRYTRLRHCPALLSRAYAVDSCGATRAGIAAPRKL